MGPKAGWRRTFPVASLRASFSILLGEDARRREFGRCVALIEKSSIRPHPSMRCRSERPAPLEALTPVVERRGGVYS